MEGEVKEERERGARVELIPEIHFVPGLSQDQPIFHYMQYNHHPDSDRRRLCIENLPGMYNMSCTQLLALANTAGTSSIASYGADSQISMDSWVNSWKMESTPWILSPGSFLGTNTGIAGETTMEKTQYDVPTSPKFICDLNLTPEEMVSTRPRPTQPEFSPITLDTPGKRLPETDQEPRDPIEKSFLETGSPVGEKKRKRARDDDTEAQLKTPPQISKRKKIRPKVVREGNTRKSASKPSVKKASSTAAAAKTSEANSYVRPKRSSRRSLKFDNVSQEEDGYCGLTFTSEGRIGISVGGKIIPDTTMRVFGNIPKRRRRSRTSSPEEDPAVRNMTTTDQTISLSMSQNMCWLQFPNMQRKRRTDGSNYASSETGRDSLCSTLSLVNTVPATFMEPKGNLPGVSHISQNNHKKLARKRSSIVTRPRNFGSLKRILEGILPIKRDRKGYGTPRRSPQLKALVSKMQSDVSRKKRSNRDPIASQLNARVLHLQWRRQNSTGTSPVEIWERRFSIDAITKLFKELDITRESLCLPHNRETALILHQKTYQEQNAMVQYRRDGSIIPYPDAKKHQPKVQLDDETTRVWKLLMVSIDSEGIDGSDEDKQKWWEEERKVFHGRANSFIARMRLVQGDRRFSPWKGSVVDSVVGVFLTQNVADHSSSSAFMDLAAEFPVILNSIKGSCHEEWGSSVTDETVGNLDPRNAVATPRIRNPTCIIIDEIDDDDDDDADAVCSQETSKTSDSSISSTNQSKTMLLDPPTNSFETQFYQGISMVSSTSTCCELNLNEAPLDVENCDAFRNNVDEGSLVQPMCNHQQELKSTLQSQDLEKNTRTDLDMKNRKIMKKPPKGQPAKNKPAKNTQKESFDWDSLRRQAEIGGQKRERTERTMDTVDWDALRCTNVHKVADIIRKRGMNNMLASRIKAFLNRLVQDHENIDLEWLRDVPPDKAKEYLLSINGLGLKSVECVRLLSLHQIAFPVDTNVGRIAVRLGWVPLQPLPDELQMHLLELYPVLESVQKYLWPRLCKLDQKTLYELHYHMITFGKVFCTKVKPNCKACPMKAECRHYASAHASVCLTLPEPEESTVTIHERRYNPKPAVVNFRQSLFLTRDKEQDAKRSQNCEPIIEEPATPEPECAEHDIEDYPYDSNNEISTNFEGGTSNDPWENKDVIPIIMLNKEAGTSKDLVILSAQAASIPRQKLKTKEKLRTEHHVYELPDSHPILEGFERRELDDLYPYLLAIWTPGETANSIKPPKQRCVSQENNTLCHEKTCFPCNNIREENSQIVRGTILIPCRTAMRGGFPLNGTYFQTNEVFADHGSSINPIDVPRQWIWNLQRRIAYFGSSVSASFGGLTVEAVQYGFWRGYVCVRGFDRKNRKPKTLVKRLHCPPSNKNQD